MAYCYNDTVRCQHSFRFLQYKGQVEQAQFATHTKHRNPYKHNNLQERYNKSRQLEITDLDKMLRVVKGNAHRSKNNSSKRKPL